MKEKFAGTAYYWTTNPSVDAIEYYACYDGVFPTKDPQDLYSGDVETVGRLDIEQEFKFDYIFKQLFLFIYHFYEFFNCCVLFYEFLLLRYQFRRYHTIKHQICILSFFCWYHPYR